ncbi:MAG: hypothetical protein CMD76_01355 [Gammaproteobacteria bacterium]|nr:hypothetical protein [Gammaproteobacteria bacterium]
MGKLLLLLIFVSGLVSSNDHLNLFESTQKLSNISSVDAPKVEELDQRRLRIICEGKMAACFRSDQPDTVFIDKTLSKEIKSLTLVGIYADYLQFSKYSSIKDLRSCDIQKEFIQDLENLKLAAYFEKGSCSKFI